MILIAESLNIMSQSIGPALKSRDPKPVQEIAKQEAAAGADYIDLNIGPARKEGEALMEWTVKTVQEVTDKPLALDTTNLVAMEAGLKVCKNKRLMNSVSLQANRFEAGLDIAKKYNSDLIGLLWGAEGMPRDANERAALAVDFVYKAQEQYQIPVEHIWIDPIVTPVSVEINQVKACLEFTAMLQEMAPGCKSTCGLSNISNGAPAHLRPYLNRTYMIMLARAGMYSAIVDIFDTELVKIARGERPELVKLVHRLMDGESVDLSKLSTEEAKYAKTVRVLTGASLYSHAWLDV